MRTGIQFKRKQKQKCLCLCHAYWTDTNRDRLTGGGQSAEWDLDRHMSGFREQQSRGSALSAVPGQGKASGLGVGHSKTFAEVSWLGRAWKWGGA